MRAFVDDVRLALRQHIRQPGYAVVVVTTLALSIGATTSVFAVVNTVLFRALPFESPQDLMWIASVRSDNGNAPFSLPEYIGYQRQARSLSGLAAYASWSASLAGEEAAERLTGARMSANTFEVLGVTASAGRLLRSSDDHAAAPQVVVLSYGLWQRRYGGRME